MRRVPLAALVLAVVAGGSFLAGTRMGGAPEGFEAVADVARDIRERAAHPVSDQQLVQGAIRGMLQALDDPYAAYLDPRRAQEVRNLLSGSFVGIGLWLEEGRGGLRVSSVLPGSPASEVGIVSGDVLLEAGGRSVRDLAVSEASKLLQGPEGTTVTLLLRTGGGTEEVQVDRERISLVDVQARMLEGDVAYAHPLRFGEGTAERLRSELEGLLGRGATAIVLDLRGNGGGLADEAIRTASLFLSDGPVALVVGGDGEREEVTVEGEPLERQVPVAVVVDGGTASSAELIAGALQDRQRAEVVGAPTFGKGSVLAVEEVGGSGSAIQFTVSYFLTPDGHRIEGRGILPDVPVLPGGPTDAQLDRAIQTVVGDGGA